MQRISVVVIGLVVAAVGLVFTLQGLDVLGGSAMTGQHKWAVIGIALIVVGLGAVGWGARPRRPAG